MPKQETFLSETANGVVVEVVKTYDRSYAREVFSVAGDGARKALATSLDIQKNYEQDDIPDPDGSDYDDFLWQELLDAAVEDVRQSPSLSSFFVVTETREGKTADIYISADWPSAETFARGRITAAR
jgi:hypothetical protein